MISSFSSDQFSTQFSQNYFKQSYSVWSRSLFQWTLINSTFWWNLWSRLLWSTDEPTLIWVITDKLKTWWWMAKLHDPFLFWQSSIQMLLANINIWQNGINLKDAMPVSFRSELITSYIVTIFKQWNLLL